MASFLSTGAQVSGLLTFSFTSEISLMLGGGSLIQLHLYVTDDYLNVMRYLDEFLTPHVLPCLQKIGHRAVLHEDNTRPRRAYIVTDFLRQKNVV